MTTLEISGTNITPGIKLQKGNLKFSGKAISPASVSVFEAASDWISYYLKIPVSKTTVDINFEYSDTVSTQNLFGLLKSLADQLDSPKQLQINWFYSYGDLEMLQLGELIQARLDMEFDFIELENGQ